MHVQLLHPTDLSARDLDCWTNLAAQQQFRSPYFQPQFTLEVAAVRNDVQIAKLQFPDGTTGFFPFQRSGRKAVPVGGQLSDAHGILLPDGRCFDWEPLLQKCELSAFQFHYLTADQVPSVRWKPEVDPAAVMNLESGFDAYRDRLESKSVVSQTDRKARRLARDCGSLRFEWKSDDPIAFRDLIRWKAAQYEDSAITNVFDFDWTVQLLQRLQNRSSSDLQGLLSVLYADDRAIAVHFGLRSHGVLHQWFPAYDPELRQHSPGMIHLLEMARHAEQNDVHRIDLGRMCHYKSRVATDCVNVAAGSVDLRPIARLVRRGCRRTFDWLRNSRLRVIAKAPGRMLRQMAERRQFQ